jgi:DUF1680 family protein
MCFKQEEETGRIKNFELASPQEKGDFCSNYPFDDSDVYKAIEAASYSLMLHPDPELVKYLDKIISKIAAAQEKDGYIYTARAIKDKGGKILLRTGLLLKDGKTRKVLTSYIISATSMKQQLLIIRQPARKTC